MHDMNYIRLPLANAFNVRDLGGYPCCDGKTTKWRSFLRSDSLSNLDGRDIEFLINYGLNGVVDLRSPREIEESPNVFSNLDGISYANISLITGDIDDATRAEISNPGELMPKIYLNIITQSTDKIADIFNVFASQEGCTLFHCTAGKDRTGIIAMLLMGLADIGRADIIANYTVTYIYIMQNPLIRKYASKNPDTIYSKAEYIEPSLDYISNNFGSVRGYLKSTGLSDKTLDTVRRRLTD